MNFNINLATRVYVDFRKLNICFALTGVVCSFWLFFSIHTALNNSAELKKFADAKEKPSQGSVVKKVSESDYTNFIAELKKVNSILTKRSYDWLSLLANLERLVPEGIALKGVEPSATHIRLTGSGRDFSAIRKFIENLENSKTFNEIYLTDHSAIKEGNHKSINFSVTCKASAL